METLKVNIGIATFWLNGPAALSFKRMLLDGMPKEGLKSAGRTYEQQQYLYNGWIRRLPGFNLAAKPGTSLHEKGNAIDAERGSPMQTWLAKGGSLYKVNSGENLRAHEYGFYRTVPSEPWHFAYYPEKDKHLNDKKTPTETDRLFTYVWANGRAERWGGLNDNSPKRAQELAKLKPSIIGVAEFSERARNATRAELGPEWLTWPVGYCAVLWSNKSWLHGGHAEIGFGTNYHGAVRVPLTSLRNNKHTMDVISVHVRPADSYPGQTDSYILKRKREQIERTLTELLRPGKPTIIGGDFNTTHAADIFTKHGLVLAVNHDIDQIWTTPDIGIRKGTVYDPGNVSDHKWLMLQGTLRANTT